VASLDIVPADTAFLLRDAPQSRAVRRDRQQQGLGEAYQPAVRADGPGPVPNAGRQLQQRAGQDRGRPHDPELKKSLAFLVDMVSAEIFVYAEPSFHQTVELMPGTYGAVQFSGMTAAMQMPIAATSPSRMEEIQGKAFVQASAARSISSSSPTWSSA